MNIMSVDGGGYLGLATVRLLASLEDHFGCKCADRFDLFCGTSTGGIIACGLAMGHSAADLLTFYKSLGPAVFGRKRSRLQLFRSKFKQDYLRRALSSVMEDTTLGDIKARKKMLMVTAFNLTSGHPRVFKTDHSEQLSTDDQYRLSDIALATSAAPTFFPTASIQNPNTGIAEVFCDGGVFANHPGLLALSETLHELKCPPGDVHFLSISTPRVDLAEPGVRAGEWGIWQWRRTLPRLLIDGGAAIAEEVLRRLARSWPGGLDYERIMLENPDNLEFDRADEDSTKKLLQIGHDQLDQSIKQRTERFFC